MEWISSIQSAIDYMENHLLEIKSPEEVAAHVHLSSLYLQRGFQVLTGYTLGEYMRNRKLYLAALELQSTTASVIDIAYKYGYETPASFNKAFQRFHHATPTEIKKSNGKIQSFLRLNIEVTVTGGESLSYSIEHKEKFEVVGFERSFNAETSYKKIPDFWDEMIETHCPHLVKGEPLATKIEHYISDHHIGEFGICIDENLDTGDFNYLIAGVYDGKEFPEEMVIKEIEENDWAIFDCTTETLQSVNTQIFRQWLPTNDQVELAGKYNLEWYGMDNHCQIWIPIRKKIII